MKTYELKTGQAALVDDDDFDRIAVFRWRLHSNGYVSCNLRSGTPQQKTMYLHRFILRDPNTYIDHVNGNKLDNRKSNLRLCTMSQNLANTGSPRVLKTSCFKGVCWFARTSKWTAQITVNQKKIHLGYFSAEDDAATAYNTAARKHFGEYAKLNVVTMLMRK